MWGTVGDLESGNFLRNSVSSPLLFNSAIFSFCPVAGNLRSSSPGLLKLGHNGHDVGEFKFVLNTRSETVGKLSDVFSGFPLL